MSNPANYRPELVLRGVDWIKSRQSELIKSIALELASIKNNTVPATEFEALANNSLTGMISRLEGNAFDSSSTKHILMGAMRQGINLKDMIYTADILLKVITEKSRDGLRPDVREALLKKAAYYTNLLKASMGASLVQYEGYRMTTGKLPPLE